MRVMPKDPIQELKESVTQILPLIDELRTEINASRQKSAHGIMEKIREKLGSVMNRLESEFGWLSLKEQEPKKRSMFGGK